MTNDGRTHDGERLMRLPEVQRRVGVSKSTIYGWARNGQFPAPVKIGSAEKISAWRASDIEAWLRSQLEK